MATQATTVFERRRVALASFVGTSVEWYDFYLYGTASALILGPLFFPSATPAGGILAAFATYAVGFLARPLGARSPVTSVIASAASGSWSCHWS